jgi:hypothetical protein
MLWAGISSVEKGNELGFQKQQTYQLKIFL